MNSSNMSINKNMNVLVHYCTVLKPSKLIALNFKIHLLPIILLTQSFHNRRDRLMADGLQDYFEYLFFKFKNSIYL